MRARTERLRCPHLPVGRWGDFLPMRAIVLASEEVQSTGPGADV